MRAGALVIVLSLFVMIPAQIGRSTEADSTLVVAALRALEQNYFKAVDPVALLNGAIAGLRKAAKLGSEALPDIPGASTEAQAIATFNRAFDRAATLSKLPQKELAYQATRDMVNSLGEAQTYYYDPAQFAEMQKQYAGAAAYAGIGVTTRSEKDASGVSWIFLDDVYPHSPAEVAGLKRFDKIVEVDGKPFQNVVLADVPHFLRGPAGSTVSLVVQRRSERLTVSVVRAPIQAGVRAQMVRPGIAYLKIYYFSKGTGEEIRQALPSLAAQGSIRALILDLRGNQGGSFSEVASVAGVFLPRQTVIALAIHKAGTSPLVSTGDPLFPSVPMAVLSDSGTATASEILLVGFRAAHRVTIVGEKTAGVGGGGVNVNLPAGGLHVTVEMVVSPRSEPIQGVGVTPDLGVALTGADVERGVDTQLDAALSAILK